MIRTVWLDNPPVNVLDDAMLGALRDELGALPPDTRVVVLRGRGERAFSAGADVAAFRSGDGDGPAGGIRATADLIESIDVPVVAAIHGHCLGGGLELALACDIRVAHEDASLGLPEVRLGLLPGGGGTQRLPRRIGPGRAAWLLLSGVRIPARQAEQWGLVELVVDDLEAGIDHVAGTIAQQSPHAVRELKGLLAATRERRSDEAEQHAFLRCLHSDDGQEGIAAFLERREPRWAGR